MFLMVSILLLLSACSKDEQYWPTDEWKVSSPESQGMDSEILVEMFEHIETDDIGELFGLVVVRNGHIVLESYPSNIYGDRKSTRLNSSHVAISYAVFCLK